MGSCTDWPSGDAESHGLWKVLVYVIHLHKHVHAGLFFFPLLTNYTYAHSFNIFAFTHKQCFQMNLS